MSVPSPDSTWQLLRRVGLAVVSSGASPRRIAVVASGSIAAGALSGLVPAFVGLGVAGLGGSGAPAVGIVAPLGRVLAGRPAALWIACALALVTATVMASLFAARAASHLTADVTAQLRVAMTRAAIGTSPRELEAAAGAMGGPAPPPGMPRPAPGPGPAPPGVKPPGPPGTAGPGAPTGRGPDIVKIGILRDSQGAAELVVAALTNLPQSLAALVAIAVDVSSSGSWLAFVLGIGIFGVSRLLSMRASRRVGAASADVARSDATVLGEIGEKLTHLEDLRLLGARPAAVREVERAAGDAARARRGLAEAMALAGQTAGLVTALAPLVVLMTLSVSHATVAPSEVARLLVAVPLLVGRLGAVDALRVAAIEKRPVLAGVVAILALPPAPAPAATTFGLDAVDGSAIEIQDVSFRPPGAARSLLDHVSASIPAGGVVGVCGTSGGGKSTLLRILLRLDEPTSGAVRVGGKPLAELDPDALPRLFAVATQGSRLLQRSVLENVALGRVAAEGGEDPQVHEAHARRALEVAQIPDLASEDGLARKFVRAPPSLSGGEERRVVVARAVAQSARVLVLDEPEAGLPRATARAMFEALCEARDGRTIVVVTHVPQLLPGATLVVLDHGKVVGVGTHAELSETCAVYAKLYVEPAERAAGDTSTTEPPGPAS